VRKYIDDRMKELQGIHPSIGDFRNTGLLGCIELIKNKDTREPMAPFNAKATDMTIMNEISASLRKSGLYTFVKWNYIFITPPLNITIEQAEDGLCLISEALKIADEYC